MIAWFSDIAEIKTLFLHLAERDAEITAQLARMNAVAGYCTACRQPSTFNVTAGHEQPGEWRNVLEGMQCPCGTNGRTRLALEFWRDVRRRFRPSDVLIFEQVTPLFSLMKAEDDKIQSCEFIDSKKISGQVYEQYGTMIRHENIMNLSCKDQSLDLIMHFDVIEHVPDHKKAFSECYRSLRPGGGMLFTLPFYSGLDRHLVSAKVTAEGIEHMLEPAYHGNPMGDGALVYFHPGWQLVEELRDSGFCIDIGFGYDPLIGIVSNGCPFPDGHMWPVVFLAHRPAK